MARVQQARTRRLRSTKSTAVLTFKTTAVDDGFRLKANTPEKVPNIHSVNPHDNSSGGDKNFWTTYLHGFSPTPFPLLKGIPLLSNNSPNDRYVIITGGSLPLALLSASNVSSSGVVDAICAAWAIVLSRRCDNSDTVFGLQDIENASPLKEKPLPFCVQVERHWSISEFLATVRENREKIMSSKLNPTALRFLGSEFETACRFETAVQIYRSPSLSSLGNLESLLGRPAEDLSLEISPMRFLVTCSLHNGEILFHGLADRAVFPESVARSLLDELEHNVWQILCGREISDTLIADLEAVGPYGRRLLLNQNRPVPPRIDAFIHNTIAERVKEHSQDTAVDAWDATLSYSELWSKSRSLAEHLLNLSCGPGMFVPIIVERSSHSIIALLAVLLVGAAVVPLDPKIPLVRRDAVITDVKASVILVSEHYYGSVTRGRIASVKHVVVLSEDLLTSKDSTDTPSDAVLHDMQLHPDDPAYVMFTSGSTGKPKGVIVSHSSFLASSAGFTKAILLTDPRSRVLHYSSFSFDASILEIISTLTIGACICVPSEEDRLNDIGKYIASSRVSWAMLTPSVASLLDPRGVPGLKVLCFVGEALSPELADQWAGQVKTINGYGPAEASVLTIVSEPRIPGSGTVYLGRPPNGAVWIVDQHNFNRLAPLHSVGEIVLEGPGIATGYLNDPEQTATSFVEDPEFLRPMIGTAIRGFPIRVYRTGDLGRLNPDGTIEYLGRKDDQIKIRGQRVELGEIEHHVKNLLGPSFEVVADVLRSTDQNDKGDSSHSAAIILACFVCRRCTTPMTATKGSILFRPDDTNLTAREITITAEGTARKLDAVLPSYMIPRVFLPCRFIPRTPSGKTDRKRLRALRHETVTKMWLTRQDSTAATLATDTGNKATLNPTELLLRGIWSRILGIAEGTIGPNDDLLKLGADSLSVIKMVSACREAGLQVTFANVFQRPRLSDMAALCQITRTLPLEATNIPSTTHQPTPPREIRPFDLLDPLEVHNLVEEACAQCAVPRENIEDMYPSTKMQEGLMAVNMTRPGSYTAQFVHALPQGTDSIRLQKAWDELYQTFPILRTRFVVTMAGSFQVVVRGTINWNITSDLDQYLKEDNAPMLPGSPLSRFALITSPDNDGSATHFVWTLHHVLYDGWTLALMIQRANNLYNRSSVPPADDFRRFIAYTQGLDAVKLDEYWKNELRGVSPSTFPVVPREGYLSIARIVVRDRLDFTTGASQHLPPGLTLPTLIQGAWAIMLSSFSSNEDVLFGTTISGRTAPLPNIENIPGPVLSTVPARFRVRSDQSVFEFLHHVQNHLIDLVSYEHAGLQRIMAINQDTRRGCQFQNLLVVQFPWQSDGDEGPLGKPMYREEITTYPVTCEARVLEKGAGVEFATHVDEEIVDRMGVVRAIGVVKMILHQLMRLSPSSAITLGELGLNAELEDQESQEEGAISAAATLTDDRTGSMIRSQPLPAAIHRCIHDIISQMATSQPDAEALYSSRRSISYRTLETLSSNLASYLINIGVEVGSVVPLCMEKSLEAVICLLAVLKAGAAFVCLDPNQPAGRLRMIVQNIRASFLLTSPLHSRATVLPVENIMVVHPRWLERLQTPKDHQSLFSNRATPDDLAYLIYTSGSTGKPKGVMISHRSFCSSAVEHGPRQGLRPQESRVLQFASYAFDASLVEILTSLIHGCTVCVPTETERVEGLIPFMENARVTYSVLTPSVARLLEPSHLPLLETLVLVGESADETLITRWLDAKVEVYIGYGPSECSVVLTAQRMTPGMDARNIGFPVACRLWVIDPENVNELLPPGQIGELLAEGPTLARGYLHDELGTANSFIDFPTWGSTPNPLQGSSPSSPSVQRMYRTGDLVQLNSDGSFLYIGRKDTQVKVNGQRIELGEIESHLVQCAGVRTALVFLPQEGHFAGQLTAVIEFDGAKGHDKLSTIQAVLSVRIPAAMMPTNWLDVITLSDKGKIPLLTSGKADRRTVLSWLIEYQSSPSSSETSNPRQGILYPNRNHVEDVSLGVATTSTNTGTIKDGEILAWELAFKISSMLHGQKLLAIQRDGGFEDAVLSLSGLDSLKMMELIYHIFGKYQARLRMEFLMDRSTTIRKVAQNIRASLSSTTVTDSSDQRGAKREPINLTAKINELDALLGSEQRAASQLGDNVRHNTPVDEQQGLHSSNHNGGYHMSHGADRTCCRSMTDHRSVLPYHDQCSKCLQSARLKDRGLVVFLTGGTGFLGTQILRQLLESPSVVRVVALARHRPSQSAQSRIIDTARKALWWDNLHAEKLEVWPGDLADAHLGLDVKFWNELANLDPNSRGIDAIVHAGATVHWTKSYEDLEEVNVRSTLALLQLAVQGSRPEVRKPKLIYISGGRQWKSEFESEQDIVRDLAEDIGYSQTKFVAEAIIHRRARRLLAAKHNHLTIIKPGLIIGTLHEGVPNLDDYLWRLTAANISVGAFNASESSEWIYLSHAATVANMVVDAAVTQVDSLQPVEYAHDGMTWGMFWSIIQHMGYPLRPHTGPEWSTIVQADLQTRREKHPLWPLSHMLEAELAHGKKLNQDVHTPTTVCPNSNPLLPVHLRLAVIRNVKFLINLAFLPAPPDSPVSMDSISVASQGFSRS